MEGRRAGAWGAGGWEAAQTAAGARWWHYEDKGTEITGVLGWPLPLGLPTHGMGVASLVPPSQHPACPPEKGEQNLDRGIWAQTPSKAAGQRGSLLLTRPPPRPAPRDTGFSRAPTAGQRLEH